MKVPFHVVEERRHRLAEYLQQHSYAPLQKVCAEFKTSEATARRDLAALAAERRIVRTYGGALMEFTTRFPSFRERQEARSVAKRKIAAAARDAIEPGATCYFDFGTTIFSVAEELRRRPVADLQVVTNSLPVAELLSVSPGLRVHLLGGQLLPRQSALVGRAARKALGLYSIDQAFFSAEAADQAGVWNSVEDLVALQRKVLEQASRCILCIDSSKLRRTAPAFLAPWNDFDLMITDGNPNLRGFPKMEKLLV